MPNRLSIWFSQRIHRAKLHLFRSYRDFDALRLDRDRWRRECIDEGNKRSVLNRELFDLRKELAEAEQRVQSETACKEQATLQLLSERTLRQASDARAAGYHTELVQALKASANWASRNMNNRSMFADVNAAADPPVEARTAGPIGRVKPFARDIGRQTTESTLRSVLEEIRSMPEEVHSRDAQGAHANQQVGPEFTSLSAG